MLFTSERKKQIYLNIFVARWISSSSTSSSHRSKFEARRKTQILQMQIRTFLVRSGSVRTFDIEQSHTELGMQSEHTHRLNIISLASPLKSTYANVCGRGSSISDGGSLLIYCILTLSTLNHREQMQKAVMMVWRAHWIPRNSRLLV